MAGGIFDADIVMMTFCENRRELKAPAAVVCGSE